MELINPTLSIYFYRVGLCSTPFFISGYVAALKATDAIGLNIARGSRELEVHWITDHARVLNGEL